MCFGRFWPSGNWESQPFFRLKRLWLLPKKVTLCFCWENFPTLMKPFVDLERIQPVASPSFQRESTVQENHFVDFNRSFSKWKCPTQNPPNQEASILPVSTPFCYFSLVFSFFCPMWHILCISRLGNGKRVTNCWRQSPQWVSTLPLFLISLFLTTDCFLASRKEIRETYFKMALTAWNERCWLCLLLLQVFSFWNDTNGDIKFINIDHRHFWTGIYQVTERRQPKQQTNKNTG